MDLKRLIYSLGLTIILSGCSQSSNIEPSNTVSDSLTPPAVSATLYDYTLHPSMTPATDKRESNDTPLPIWTLTELVDTIQEADVILIGEWHGHPATHRLQADLLAALYTKRPHLTLSMEQFSRDKQYVLNQYLAGDIGEETLIQQAKAWPNYRSDYRPLIEFAKQQQLTVIAANAPRAIVRCVGKFGPGYLHRLPPIERSWVADTLTLDNDAYQQTFNERMGGGMHGHHGGNNHFFAAQTTWDDTMAESIVKHLALFPHRQVVHTAGRFHVAQGLGLASRIAARAPQLTVVMITPITDQDSLPADAPDYPFTVPALPARYVSEKEMQQSVRKRFKSVSMGTCREE